MAANEEGSAQPQQPPVRDAFKNCEQGSYQPQLPLVRDSCSLPMDPASGIDSDIASDGCKKKERRKKKDTAGADDCGDGDTGKRKKKKDRPRCSIALDARADEVKLEEVATTPASAETPATTAAPAKGADSYGRYGCGARERCGDKRKKDGGSRERRGTQCDEERAGAGVCQPDERRRLLLAAANARAAAAQRTFWAIAAECRAVAGADSCDEG